LTHRNYSWGLVLHVGAFVLCGWLALCLGVAGQFARAAILAAGAIVFMVMLFRFELRYRRERDPAGEPYTCTRCGYGGFRSKDGKLAEGTCPNPVYVDVPYDDGTKERLVVSCPLVPSR
jgi:hypothetical protein